MKCDLISAFVETKERIYYEPRRGKRRNWKENEYLMRKNCGKNIYFITMTCVRHSDDSFSSNQVFFSHIYHTDLVD